jgi:hypothetical protein
VKSSGWLCVQAAAKVDIDRSDFAAFELVVFGLTEAFAVLPLADIAASPDV